MLVDEGTTIRKFCLHISKDEQRQRLQERIDDPRKRWKWSSRDLHECARWDDCRQAYEDTLAAMDLKLPAGEPGIEGLQGT
jgi:polyphosphate kinase 2 (PPK2 family)